MKLSSVVATVKPAICPVCGDPVPYAFYDVNGRLVIYPENYVICTDKNVAYHYSLEKDCWGKHTGYPNFRGGLRK